MSRRRRTRQHIKATRCCHIAVDHARRYLAHTVGQQSTAFQAPCYITRQLFRQREKGQLGGWQRTRRAIDQLALRRVRGRRELLSTERRHSPRFVRDGCEISAVDARAKVVPKSAQTGGLFWYGCILSPLLSFSVDGFYYELFVWCTGHTAVTRSAGIAGAFKRAQSGSACPSHGNIQKQSV